MKNLELFYLKIRWSDPSGLFQSFYDIYRVHNASDNHWKTGKRNLHPFKCQRCINDSIQGNSETGNKVFVLPSKVKSTVAFRIKRFYTKHIYVKLGREKFETNK